MKMFMIQIMAPNLIKIMVGLAWISQKYTAEATPH